MSTNQENKTGSAMRALAIGPRELLSGLAAFGVEVRHATSAEEVLESVKTVRAEQTENPYALIFITESIVKEMSEAEYGTVMGDDLPVVLTIPDLNSEPNAGLEKLASLTKRAVGVDIFSK